MKKMYVGNLPDNASEESVSKLFSEFGTVRSIRVNTDIFSGKCRGFGFIEMEGHEARAAIEMLDGNDLEEKSLRVHFDDTRRSARGKRRR